MGLLYCDLLKFARILGQITKTAHKRAVFWKKSLFSERKFNAAVFETPFFTVVVGNGFSVAFAHDF